MKAVFQRAGFSLVPTDDTGRTIIAGLPIGKKVMVEVRTARNPDHHRLLFAVLQAVVQNSDWPTVEDLLEAIKVELGHTERRHTMSGKVYLVPKSIAFESMKQEEFRVFFDGAIDLITTRIIPGLKREDLLSHVEELLRGRAA